MPFIDTLRSALAEPPKTPLRQPDPYHVIRLARRRRRRRTIGVAVAAVVLVAVGSTALRRLTTVDGLEVVSAASATSGIPSSSALPTAATGATAHGGSAPAQGAPTPTRPDPIDTTATVVTPTLSRHNSEGSTGFGMPQGGGSESGVGVAVSTSGRYQLDMACSGAWQNRAVEVRFEGMSAPHTRLPDGHPAGTFLCKSAQSTEQVVLDASTTQQLQTLGSMVLMDFSVVRLSDDGSGYVSIGPLLTDMSITFGGLQVMDPR